MSENSVMQKIRLDAVAEGARLFRNNVGLFDTLDGRKIRTGLCVGSSDLIGWTEVTITPEMVGRKVAVFTAVEVKAPRGRLTKEQAAFIAAVNRHGGIGIKATTVRGALEGLREFSVSADQGCGAR